MVVIEDSTQMNPKNVFSVLRRLSRSINYCRLFWWHFSLVRVVWLSRRIKDTMCVYGALTRSRSHLIRLYWISMCLWGHQDWYCFPLNSGVSLFLAGHEFGSLWVMGGNHFPCLLNKTIKKHYELASGKAFACHCLHLFEGVSVLSCFFSLVQNKML